MIISIKSVIRKDKINRENCAPINLRITLKSKSRYISTGATLPLDAWSVDNQQINPCYPNAGELQFKIDAIRVEYEKKIKRLQALDMEVTFDTLFETNGRKAGITIEDGFKAEAERLEALGKYTSAAKHKSALNAYKSVKMASEAIDLDYLKGLETFLRQLGNTSNSGKKRINYPLCNGGKCPLTLKHGKS